MLGLTQTVAIPLALVVFAPPAAAATSVTEAPATSRPDVSATSESAAPTRADSPGTLVLAADRGFMGNEELRDAFDSFVETTGANARLVLLTGRGDSEKLKAARAELNARDTVVLPLFLSDDHPRFIEARAALTRATSLRWADHFGRSYFAVEILADRLQTIERPKRHNAVLLSYGALTDAQRQAMQADLDTLASQAAAGLGLRRVRSLVWHEYGSPGEEQHRKQVTREFVREFFRVGRTAVVPFNLGIKLDSMMSISGYVKRYLPRGSQYVGGDVLPHPAVAQWMERELNRHRSLTLDDMGVVFLAHGADFDWNETMRQAIEPLTRKYKIEFAFSMADRPVVESAIRRLERRGAAAIVVVRVFGLESSFKSTVDRMLGRDIEHHGHHDHHGHHGHRGHGRSGGHGHHDMNSGPRIRSAARLVSVGGVEDHALFASALLDRARALSTSPSTETVVLTAHGSGSDEANGHWMKVLASLARQMKAQGGGEFRSIEFGTWREDWPKKREPEIERIRGLVKRASAGGGRALVIPTRTASEGPERELLEGLQYELGSGFAPSAQFSRWVEEQILEGARQLGVVAPHPSQRSRAQAAQHAQPED